ncbi:MAG: hypothetical protein VW683_06755 [Betaproteobacteria bacterium]
MANKFDYVPIIALSGVDKDNTSLSTGHYTDASNIRFYDGRPRKLGGNLDFSFDNSNTISGCARTVYSQVLSDKVTTLIGTNTRLYAVISSELTNITPLVTSTTTIANSVSTNYQILGSNPATTTSGSADVVISSTAHVLQAGDSVVLSMFPTDVTLGADPLDTVNTSTTITINQTSQPYGLGDTVHISGVSGAVNGIPASEINGYHTVANPLTNSFDIVVTTPATSTASGGGSSVVSGGLAVPSSELNATHIVRSTNTNDYTITVTTAATSSGSGGGGSVVEATAVLTITDTGHGLPDGDRIKLTLSTAVGGVPAGEINAEHIIRDAQTNTYNIVVSTVATSSVSGGGGASTARQEQIAAGNCNGGQGIGYGVGRYGTGRYGVSKTSSSNITFPRIWSFDRYGANVIMSAGDETGVYSWDGDTSAAPTLITNAPTDVDYVFSYKNFIITLRGRRVKWSDQGQSTVWTGTAQNQAGEDDIEDADDFISHAEVKNGVVLFTRGRKIVKMTYVGRANLVWSFKTLQVPDGIIARNARISINDTAYWQGNNNFWKYDGGDPVPLRSNSRTGHNYVRRYVYNDINTAQKDKCFMWYNSLWDEIWIHYPSSGSNEPDRVIRWSRSEKHFTPDTLSRTAAEAPYISSVNPRLIGTDNKMYRHELGLNDDTGTLDWSLTLPLLQVGSNCLYVGGMIPDSTQTGDISVSVKGLPYPQDANPDYAQTDGVARTTVSNFTISNTTGRLSMFLTNRDIEVTISQSSVTDGDWIMGAWKLETKPSDERKR